MNKQRKVVITVTYNELGVIVDTKAEELDSSVHPSFSRGQENDHRAEPCEDAVSRADMLNELDGWIEGFDANCHKESFADMKLVRSSMSKLPSVTPKAEQRWIPVTLETLPNPSSVVVVCGKKGTWDYGTYRGWYGDIHSWQWKNNTIKHVYWWMYKTDALPEPYREEGKQEWDSTEY